MKYLSYPQYKKLDSAWLGNIPSDWSLKKLKFVAKPQPSNVDKKIIEGEVSVTLCNYTDVYKNEFINTSMTFMEATATPDEIKKFKLNVGDVIVTKDSETPHDIAVPALVVEESENLLCGYHLTQIKQVEMDGRYLFRLFQSKGFNAQFIVQANGVTRFGLPSFAISNALTPVPLIDEQKKIADFLDYKTAKIDTLIAKKETLLLRLQEKRATLITQAVTKGINPDATMKNSGVEWLGDVPAHWEILNLRHVLMEPLSNGLFKKKDQWGAGSPIVDVFDVYVSGDVIQERSLQKVSCDSSDLSKYSAVHGDFFFVRSSLKLEGIGKSAVVINPTEPMVFECHLVRGRPNINKITPKFSCYFLNSYVCRKTLITLSNQVTMTTLDQEKFKSLNIPLPPVAEQNEISEYLDAKIFEIDNQASRIKEAISKLQEYRAALITSAVTGKIDVRDFKIPVSAN